MGAVVYPTSGASAAVLPQRHGKIILTCLIHFASLIAWLGAQARPTLDLTSLICMQEGWATCSSSLNIFPPSGEFYVMRRAGCDGKICSFVLGRPGMEPELQYSPLSKGTMYICVYMKYCIYNVSSSFFLLFGAHLSSCKMGLG